MYHTLSFNLTNRQWGNLPNSSSNFTRSNSNSFNSMHSNSSNSTHSSNSACYNSMHSSLQLTVLYPALTRHGIPTLVRTSTCRTSNRTFSPNCKHVLYFSLVIELLLLKHSGYIRGQFFHRFVVDHITQLYS